MYVFRGNINLMKADTTAAEAAFREAVKRDPEQIRKPKGDCRRSGSSRDPRFGARPPRVIRERTIFTFAPLRAQAPARRATARAESLVHRRR